MFRFVVGGRLFSTENVYRKRREESIRDTMKTKGKVVGGLSIMASITPAGLQSSRDLDGPRILARGFCDMYRGLSRRVFGSIIDTLDDTS